MCFSSLPFNMHLILNCFSFSQLFRSAKTSTNFYSSFFCLLNVLFFVCPGSLLNWSWNRPNPTDLHLLTLGFNLAPTVTPYWTMSQLRPDLGWNRAQGWGGRVHGGGDQGVGWLEHHSIWVLICTVRTPVTRGEQKYISWEKCKLHTTHIDTGSCLALLVASLTLTSNLTPPMPVSV